MSDSVKETRVKESDRRSALGLAMPAVVLAAPWSQLRRLLLPRRPSNGPRCQVFPAVVISRRFLSV